MVANAPKPERRAEPHILWWLLTNRVSVGLAILVAILIILRVEEDVRGKLAWQRCRRELLARGQSLDWDALVPPPVPDSQNVFAAPKMRDWFVRGESGDLGSRMSLSAFFDYTKRQSPRTLAELAIAPLDVTHALPDADLVLQYKFPVLSLAEESAARVGETGPQVLPLIWLDAVPLSDAIKLLASQAGIEYVIAPEIAAEYGMPGTPQPSVTVRWEKITARHALLSVLSNHRLALTENPETGIAVIQNDHPSRPRICVDAEVSERLTRLIGQAGANEVRYANGSQGIRLLDRVQPVGKPFRLLLRSSGTPPPHELKQFFPEKALRRMPSSATQLSVQRDGTNSFSVSLAPDQVAAADYLAWSDQFLPAFDLMREAFQRPSARIDGDYARPFSSPIVNFVAIRTVAQTLAQRAQACLLLNEPDKALRELRLLHELNRLLETQPATLVSAMIEVAVTGLYTYVVADGFRLGAWREPQLIALQQQLEEVSLTARLHSAFVSERAAVCRTLESQSAVEIVRPISSPPATLTFWQQLQDPKSLLLSLTPRGWRLQNMVVVARLEQRFLDGIDPDRQTLSPRRIEGRMRDVDSAFKRLNPHNFLAAMCVPNFFRACQTLARNQALVNEALLACALERHRLARGSFPDQLDRLVPDFAHRLPPDPINGRPLLYRQIGASEFRLYSVGWNESDDGGLLIHDQNGTPRMDEGDWVWDPNEDRK